MTADLLPDRVVNLLSLAGLSSSVLMALVSICCISVMQLLFISTCWDNCWARLCFACSVFADRFLGGNHTSQHLLGSLSATFSSLDTVWQTILVTNSGHTGTYVTLQVSTRLQCEANIDLTHHVHWHHTPKQRCKPADGDIVWEIWSNVNSGIACSSKSCMVKLLNFKCESASQCSTYRVQLRCP